ncbi:scavenger receptor cysteine-rich type 1 protein M130-like [Haliotis rubra]|uniref:scavenger receptor cysteine-rich type 1 protein M130-like n=1 Tax=Haliotis rubra TaxID=36100 RepID=UPI001EE5D9F9|nr:scavenger receptor cysteine-rich type 1 protein M130-like [Haliotis rubra]
MKGTQQLLRRDKGVGQKLSVNVRLEGSSILKYTQTIKPLLAELWAGGTQGKDKSGSYDPLVQLGDLMLRSGIMDKRLEIPLMFLASLVISVFGQTIRLVSPLDNGVGRLEVYYNGMWGTVCDDGFGVEEAKVACRQLGRSKSGVTPRAIQSFGFGVGRIWLDDVSCSGTESSLASCSHNPWGANGCSHSEDVGIICDPSDITMKLTPSYKRGLLQVFHSGSWGTVCDDGFGPVEAAVVCRALGYGLGNVIDVSSSNKMWLDDVQCTMLDTDLKDCKHRPWGTHNCGASDAVGVECFSFPEAIHLEPPGSVLNVTLGQVISVVCVGDDFNYPATSFRWTHSGRSYSGQTFSERITSKNDSGTLRCQVVNAMACTEISVWYPPEVHLEPSNDTINVAVGEDLRVQCVVDDANPSVHTFRWSHNGRTSAGSTFLKRNVTKSDQGQLTCSADNGHMMTPGRADTTVNVRYPPKLHLEPNQPVINVKQGGDVTVVCVVDDANPSATSYMWLHNNNISHGQLFTKGDLSTSDAGNLSCSATNGQGTSLEESTCCKT